LHGFSGPLGLKWEFRGQNRGRDGAILTSKELGVLTSVPILVKIDQEIRLCSQTDRHTHTDWQTQNDFIICPMLYAIAMWQIISYEMIRKQKMKLFS